MAIGKILPIPTIVLNSINEWHQSRYFGNIIWNNNEKYYNVKTRNVELVGEAKIAKTEIMK